MAGFLFLLGLAAYTRNNQFRYYYHPDESGKVEQIAQGRRNFHHPLLMLTATRLAITFSPVQKKNLSRQQIVVIGRWTVAGFAAGSAVALALLARSLAGPWTGWTAGFAVLSDRLLFELAHYMKEDPVLVFGFALVLLALRFLETHPSRNALIFLGTACAAASAGKYLGLVTIPVGLLAAWKTDSCPLPARRRILLFGGACLLAWLAFNPQLLSKPGLLFKGFGREAQIVAEGHKGLSQSVPHAYYFHTFKSWIPLAVSVLAGFQLLHMLLRPKRQSGSTWTAAALTLILLILLSFSPKTSTRYFLPISVLTSFLGALGLGTACQWLLQNRPSARFLRPAIHLSFLGVLCASQAPALATKDAGFTRESRLNLRRWIEQNLPSDAVIAQDDRVNLPSPEKQEHRAETPISQRVLRAEFVADLARGGGLAALRASGVTHVAVSAPSYERFFDARFMPGAAAKEAFALRRGFYEELFAKGELLWSEAQGSVLYLEPGLKLFSLPAHP
ncbi:MAG: hypothetical protein RLZZ253_203 [Verrucomicrobiota bacterium]|jgi:hypothetical protein